MWPYRNISYFPGLQGMRFVAAYLVLLHHAEQIRMKHGLPHFKAYSLFNNGELAVTFFFVLSGFLITYLLLRERAHTGTVAIGGFYMRRILRIWPLYFLLVFIGTLAVPLALKLIGHAYEMPYAFGEAFPYFALFAPFVVTLLFGHHLLEPLWSIGVEELFYLGWAPLAKAAKKYLGHAIVTVLLLKIALNMAAQWLPLPLLWKQVVYVLQFEAMCIGALGAYWLYHRQRAIEGLWLFQKPAQWLLLGFLAARIGAHRFLMENVPLWNWLFSAPQLPNLLLMLAFCWLNINLSVNSQRLFAFESPRLRFLGDISYGVYMYQMLVIFALILVLKPLLLPLGAWWGSLAFYLLATAGVCAVAALSKRYFEASFLALKGRW